MNIFHLNFNFGSIPVPLILISLLYSTQHDIICLSKNRVWGGVFTYMFNRQNRLFCILFIRGFMDNQIFKNQYALERIV